MTPALRTSQMGPTLSMSDAGLLTHEAKSFAMLIASPVCVPKDSVVQYDHEVSLLEPGYYI
ncbi:hypothetical protein E2C01_016047 [Portunus trituberculatus]|uniref:Uncharacterized protein n=1 Tax=Portunus trituberculatus TaxID=210409 RepID=A0A5B7DPX4_PORTR|nr:hypothetical protein [Portunus trituberculatus]